MNFSATIHLPTSVVVITHSSGDVWKYQLSKVQSNAPWDLHPVASNAKAANPTLEPAARDAARVFVRELGVPVN